MADHWLQLIVDYRLRGQALLNSVLVWIAAGIALGAWLQPVGPDMYLYTLVVLAWFAPIRILARSEDGAD